MLAAVMTKAISKEVAIEKTNVNGKVKATVKTTVNGKVDIQEF